MRITSYFYTLLIGCIFLVSSFVAQSQKKPSVADYVTVLSKQGASPKEFVIKKLKQHDLLIFDDALHTAKDPFDFYAELLKDSSFQRQVKYVFVEVFSVNHQPVIDQYLNAEKEDSSILFPAFQYDLGEFGWPYKTYFDLLKTVWEVNQTLLKEERIKVIAVNAPTYWQLLKTPADVTQYQELSNWNDYTMYKTILVGLNHFKEGRKGIFLTNTRHAYKRIKDSTGTYYWNSGTFFHQWHPGKTYAIRFHNATLHFKRKAVAAERKSMQGLEGVDISWQRMEQGLWDLAFKQNGSRPVAIDINNNVFGKATYIGNHMLNAKAGQTMRDAYDAIIFLKPLEELQETAKVDWIYTEAYLDELERRVRILMTKEQIEEELKRSETDSINAYLKRILAPRAARISPISKLLPALPQKLPMNNNSK